MYFYQVKLNWKKKFIITRRNHGDLKILSFHSKYFTWLLNGWKTSESPGPGPLKHHPSTPVFHRGSSLFLCFQKTTLENLILLIYPVTWLHHSVLPRSMSFNIFSCEMFASVGTALLTPSNIQEQQTYTFSKQYRLSWNDSFDWFVSLNLLCLPGVIEPWLWWESNKKTWAVLPMNSGAAHFTVNSDRPFKNQNEKNHIVGTM